jgi:hypothetical protein
MIAANEDDMHEHVPPSVLRSLQNPWQTACHYRIDYNNVLNSNGDLSIFKFCCTNLTDTFMLPQQLGAKVSGTAASSNATNVTSTAASSN